MTNRECLETLNNEDFARIVLTKASEFEHKNYNEEIDSFDYIENVQFDFEKWLESNYIKQCP